MSDVESPLSSATKRCADRDHGRASRVNGLDDLCVIDALEVDGGDAEVAMAKLALDDDKRHSLVRHLDRAGVPKLMRRKSAPHASHRGVRRSVARAAALDQ
jgi:hypothetical protein